MVNGQKTDLQLANEALMALRVNVTASDLKEAPVSEPTILRYFEGNGRKLDTAMKLLKYFRGRIEERRKEIIES